MPLRPLAIVFFCMLLAAGCGEDPVQPTETDVGWQWLNPVTEGADLTDVWAVSPERALAVGDEGTILLYADGVCRVVPSGVTADLHAIRATGAGRYLVVGAGGVVLEGDGLTWSTLPGPGSTTELRDVWIHGDGTLHATGYEPRLTEAGGRNVAVPFATALVFDGTGWFSLEAPELVGTFTSLVAVGPADVYFGFATDPAYHYGPGGWTTFSMGLNGDDFGTGVYDQYALPDGQVFAAGSGGQVRHFDGAVWTSLNVDDRTPLNGIWAVDPDSVWVVGGHEIGVAARHSAADWRWDADVSARALHAVDGGADGGIFAVGAGGTFIRRRAERWRPVNGFTANAVTCIWGRAADDLYLGGDDGIFHFDGENFTQVPAGLIYVRGIWGVGPDDIYAVGTPVGPVSSGLVHYDGTGWRAESFDEDLFVRFDAVGGDGQGTVFTTVGNRIYRRVGGVWQLDFQLDLPVWWTALQAFPGGSAVAVGGRGTMAVFDGTQWALQDLSTTTDLTCLWAADPDRIFVGTADGAILSNHGGSWEASTQFSVYRIATLWGDGPTDVIAAGGGRLLRFDGTSWSEWHGGPPVAVRAAWPAPDGGLIVAGTGGAVLRGRLAP